MGNKLPKIFVQLLIIALLLCAGTSPAQAGRCEIWSPKANAAETKATGNEITKKLQEWGRQIAEWAKEFSLLTSMIGFLQDLDKIIGDELSKLGTVFVAGQSLQAQTKTKAAEGLSKNIDETLTKQTEAIVQSKTISIKMGSGYLCNLVVAQSAPSVLMFYAQMLEDRLIDMMSDRDLGEGAVGNGHSYSAQMDDMRCGRRIEYYKTGDPSKGDPPECVPDDPQFIGIDTSPSILDYEQILVMPRFLPVTVTTPSGTVTENKPILDPDEKLYEFRVKWIAARNFCYNLAGPRPQTTSAAELKGERGQAASLRYANAAAAEAKFLDVCLKRLAYITIPDCYEPSNSAVCQVGMLACGAAKAAGDPYAKSINCSNGISLYQSEYFATAICSSPAADLGQKQDGRNDSQLIQQKQRCALDRAIWKKKLIDGERHFQENLQALLRFRSLYSGAERPARGGQKVKSLQKNYFENNHLDTNASTINEKISLPSQNIISVAR